MSLATLTIDLVAKLGSLEQDLGKVSHLAEQAGNRISSAFAAIGATLSVGAFGALIKGSIDAQDRLDKLRLTTSLTVEQLSGLKFAAAIAGGDLEAMAVSIDKLAVNMGKDPEKFKALGIAAKDPLEAFKQLSDIFVKVQDPQLRAALGAAALGKAWAGAAPLLMEGGRGIGELVEKGTRLSGVSAQSAAAAAAFNDKWHELFGTGQLVNTMVGDLLPLLNSLADDLLAARDGATGLSTGFSPLLETGKAIAVLFGNVGFVLKATGTEIGGIAAQMAALGRGDLTMAANIGKIMKSDAEEARKQFDTWEAKIIGLSGKATTAVKDAAKKVRDGALESRVSTFVGTPGGAAGGKTDLQRMIELGQRNLAGSIDSEEEMAAVAAKRAIESAKASAAEADGIEKLRQKYIDLADPLQKYRVQLDEINQLRNEGRLTAPQALEAEWAVNEAIDAQVARMNDLGKVTKETDNFARDMGLAFTSAFEDAVVGGKGLSAVLKGLGTDIERILIRKTITEPAGNFLTDLFKGFGGSSAGSGLNAFGGSANGSAFDANGMVAFASGGIVNRPTLFPFAGGTGLMGEAGPEAILPLTRINGKLGVQAQGGGVTIVQNITIDSRSDRSSIMAAMAQAKAETLAAVEANIRRGGAIARAARTA